MRPFDTGILNWLGRFRRVEQTKASARRGAVDHVIILDGTMSSLVEGQETNAGIAYKLLQELLPAPGLSVRYEAGIQWQNWLSARDVVEGRGINRQIRRAYGALASRYRQGDRIFLLGYSRGAYAVRSLAGIIDRIGLLRAEAATERNVTQVYRHYRFAPDSDAARQFAAQHCHGEITIEMIGCWDTVKALGLRAPLLWRWSEPAYAFHNTSLGPTTRHGLHALALDETREAYAPVMWTNAAGVGQLEQVWFRGTHGDIGGQLGGFTEARGLSNIPLVWLLGRAERLGLELPDGWQDRFAQDPDAPSVGTSRGWGWLFLARRRRVVGTDASECIYSSVGPGHRARAPVQATSSTG